MRAQEIINESMANRLFHATGMSGLVNIFAEDRLKASVPSDVATNSEARISFSRQPQATFIERPAILVLNADRLRQTKRLTLRYGDSRRAAALASARPEEYLPVIARRETEESLKGDLTALHRYLDCLVLTTHWWEWMKETLHTGAREVAGIDVRSILAYLKRYRIPVIGTNLERAGWQATLDRDAERWD